MTSILKKGLLGGLAALTLGATIAASSTPAAAQGGFGWGLGAGLLSGVAIGALATRPYYYPPPPPYPGCYVTQRPIYDPYGNFVGYRPVRACY
jgi:hypothetical protein